MSQSELKSAWKKSEDALLATQALVQSFIDQITPILQIESSNRLPINKILDMVGIAIVELARERERLTQKAKEVRRIIFSN